MNVLKYIFNLVMVWWEMDTYILVQLINWYRLSGEHLKFFFSENLKEAQALTPQFSFLGIYSVVPVKISKLHMQKDFYINILGIFFMMENFIPTSRKHYNKSLCTPHPASTVGEIFPVLFHLFLLYFCPWFSLFLFSRSILKQLLEILFYL